MSATGATGGAFQSYVDKWLEAEPDAQLLRLFVPAAREQATAAALVLMHELEAAAFGLDPRPAQAKLAWWQEELERWRKGAPRHPVTDALGNPERAAALVPLPAATARWLELDTVGRFERWQAMAANLAAVQDRALGGEGEASDAAPLLARMLMRFPTLAADPRGLLPLDVLAEAGADRTGVASAPDGAAAIRARAALARRALATSEPVRYSSELALARAVLARRGLALAARGRDPERAMRPGIGAVLGLRRALRRYRR